MATLYIETSIIGYLTARSSDTVIFLARQQLTQEWWTQQRSKYELVTSQLVLDEAGAGDPVAAQERLNLLDSLPLLDIENPDVKPLADGLIANHLLPEKALADARHVAVATVFGVDYLLTWNCKHIANAETLPRVYKMLRDAGYEPPLIVTPEEFSGNV
ncbi:MAG: type II toxin-antitoxin system VapC family toxin [Planctomycetes bacterium]|nr:type II toxin-antitoxin system VapC family toxin [Planctomycetota bacterium]